MMEEAYNLCNGDNLAVLRSLPEHSMDSLVTDPPAGIGIREMDWDSDKGGTQHWVSWMTTVFQECHRVLKPGAHGFVWALPRTSHRTASALEASGFYIKDIVTHIFSSGRPKGIDACEALKKSKRLDMNRVHTVTKWIRDRKLEMGLTNSEIDFALNTKGSSAHWTSRGKQAHVPTPEKWKKLKDVLGAAPDWIDDLVCSHHLGNDVPETTLKDFAGWKTALRPSSEHWILVQKREPGRASAQNLLDFRTGALNITESRLPTKDRRKCANNQERTLGEIGRYPSNTLLSMSKNGRSFLSLKGRGSKRHQDFFKNFEIPEKGLYCPKPSPRERGSFNHHPTVKPTALMEYLIRMVTRPGGTVLDPFMGSGTTGIAAIRKGFRFLGIEAEKDYFYIAQRRLDEIRK